MPQHHDADGEYELALEAARAAKSLVLGSDTGIDADGRRIGTEAWVFPVRGATGSVRVELTIGLAIFQGREFGLDELGVI